MAALGAGTCSGSISNQRTCPQQHQPFQARALGPAQSRERRRHVCRGKFQDELLDLMTGGPKLRRWYGQEPQLPSDSGGTQEPPAAQQQEAEQLPADDGQQDVVLVTDAESPTGEQVVLQLILARARLRVLVRDVAAAKNAYAAYVEPLDSSVSLIPKALRDVRDLVLLGKVGPELLEAAKAAGVARIVLLSTAGVPAAGGLAGLFGGGGVDSVLRDPAREELLRGSGLRHVIVRTAGICDEPGGRSALAVSRRGGGGDGTKQAGAGPISREDLALVLARVVEQPLGGSGGLEFCVVSAGQDQPPQDWGLALQQLATASGG